MNKIQELIQLYCPNGVEYKELGEVLDYEQPTKYIVESVRYHNDHETPVLTAGQTFILGYTYETEGIYDATKENPVIIFDDFTTSFHWVDFEFKVKSSAMKMLRPKKDKGVILRFIYFVMKCITHNPQEHARQWISVYSKFQIPIPPLHIQQEIVIILDNFTQLEAELEAELEARKRQYEYYRNYLLNLEGKDVEWKTLGEVLQPKGYIRGPFGSALRKEFFQKSGVPVYEQQHAIYNHRDFRYFIDTERSQKLKRFFVLPKDIIISCSGTIGKISIIQENDLKGIINQALLILRLDHTKIHPKFMQHYLESHTNLIISSAGGAISNIEKREVIEKIKIPNLPLSEQERIVSILDKFDALVNDISVGLPAEIQTRRKQYEYYRGKLLDFKCINNG